MPFTNNDPFATNTAPEATTDTKTATAKEATITTTPNPFKIGFTLKASSGYEAEWLTPAVYGATAQETAQNGHDLLLAMQEIGLIDTFAKAADYTRAQYKGAAKPAGKPSFQNGQVQHSAAPASAPGGDILNDTCTHGRKHFAKDTWEAMFCTQREKSDQCPPAFFDKKMKKYVQK